LIFAPGIITKNQTEKAFPVLSKNSKRRSRLRRNAELENRHHDAIFASNSKKEEISTKKDQTRFRGMAR
jgi:hypothetical protein